MNPDRILIVDLNSRACPEDHSEQLGRLLRDSPSNGEITIQLATCIPVEGSSLVPDLVLLRPSGTEDLSEVIQLIRKRWGLASILGLFCTNEHAPAAVYRSLRRGLDEFLTCPFRGLDVCGRIEQLLQEKRETVTTPQAEEIRTHLHHTGMVGESAPFLRVVGEVLRVAHSEATILLSGETGTGKELMARAVHYGSAHKSGPFVPVNCGALPDHLVENELFGHVKGAYTDATISGKGLVAEAEGGTLFLDEVDTLSGSAQIKLLRFLQDRAYRPLGSSKSLLANVRIIAATNADLWQLVQGKRFREDLYYRLNVIVLHLPPLRDRHDDIPRLAVHFLNRYNAQYGNGPQRFSAAALHMLMSYSWPGNIRELETIIQRTVLLASSSVMHPCDIELPLPYPHAGVRGHSLREAKERVVEQFERTYLISLLSAQGGNVTRAARQAGKERRTFTRLIQKYGLHHRDFRALSS